MSLRSGLRLRLRRRRQWPAKLVHKARAWGHHHSSSLWTSHHHHIILRWHPHLRWMMHRHSSTSLSRQSGITRMHHRWLRRHHHRHHIIVIIHRLVRVLRLLHGIGRRRLMHGMWRHHHLRMRLWMHHRVHLLLCLRRWRWYLWTTAWPTAQSSRHGRLSRRHQLRLGLHGRPLLGAHGIVVICLLRLLIRPCVDIKNIAS